ncbi:MAG: SurA N-terminal domain-containing protein [Bdellovibrionales bacterium]|jgi:peptidyl-prolyl cis-trans isomerase D|nr:SurA N-terminal domain-containing protein [Bdellovibrionales bacterium]
MAQGSRKSQFSLLKSNLQSAWRNDRRSVIKSAVAWVLFGAIIVVFVFLGMTPQQAGVSQGGGAAVSVNGHIVSLAEFSEAVEAMGRDPRYSQLEQFGGDFARQMIRQQAIRSLVDQQLMVQNLGKIGVYTADAQVRDLISEIPAFQENGRFSRTRYLGYLQASRQGAGVFEEKMRNQLAAERVTKAFSAALRPLPFEAEILSQIEGKKANAEYVLVPTENLVIAETVAAADVKAFLEKSDAEARVKSYFDANKARYSTKEAAKVRHILVRAAKDKPEEVTKAKAEADAIVASLKGGADFAKLAKEKSADPGSKENGGLIDFFERGAMVPEFDAYAFSGKPGEVSEPIQTDFGFHVIRIEERRPASEKKLEEVREDIAEILIAQERSRDAINQLDKDLAAGNVEAVQNFVKAHRLNWAETGAFSITADTLPKAGGGEEAVSTAFRLTSEKPLAGKLVRQGPQALLLRHKTVVEPKAVAKKGPEAIESSPAYMAEVTASRRTSEVFENWLDGMRKSAQISVNPDVGATSMTP